MGSLLIDFFKMIYDDLVVAFYIVDPHTKSINVGFVVYFLYILVLVIVSIIKYKKLKKGYSNKFFINNILLITLFILNLFFYLIEKSVIAINHYLDNKFIISNSFIITIFLSILIHSYLTFPLFILICEYIINKKIKNK
ncbi:MAG: hypothetical protein NUV32_10610 [Exilispira sp.]|jgi:hypothetical protein|nr:hypothetical protein [Exilispira sp.]